MIKLIIDTSNNKEISIGLEIDGKTDIIVKQSDVWKSQIVLPLIDKLLKKHNLTLQDINAIMFNEGPGSFTGLRVGAAIANTLGTYLKIPINGKKVGEIVEPEYK
jgi:tRNA threonylcarbamoyladenosine biosynthesis protein TsaB